MKNKLKESYQDKKVDSKGKKLVEKIGAGVCNKQKKKLEDAGVIKKQRTVLTVRTFKKKKEHFNKSCEFLKFGSMSVATNDFMDSVIRKATKGGLKL